MRHIPLLAVLLAATACAPAPIADVTKAHGLPATSADLTAAPAFVETGLPAGMPVAGGHSDAEMAASFMELSFAMESGRKLPVFSRFEGTVTVALTGQVPQGAAGDLATLVRRLQSEAGIDIRPAQAGEAAAITVEFVPRARLRRAAPDAACFVVPNVTSLDDYTARRGTAATDWSIITQRRVAGIFVPADASPQEVRDCLHEEMAQALGPLNDLYRLSDSVFNDDNFNSVLTPFDMTILRAYYSPALTSGLSKSEVAARVGAVMAGINGGSGMGSADLSPTSPAWKAAIETALGGRGGQAARRAAADRRCPSPRHKAGATAGLPSAISPWRGSMSAPTGPVRCANSPPQRRSTAACPAARSRSPISTCSLPPSPWPPASRKGHPLCRPRQARWCAGARTCRCWPR
jgi:hypothetical protein